MKITIQNVNNRTEEANKMLNVILRGTLGDLEEQEINVEDVKVEEITATFSVKSEGSDDYNVISVVHEGLNELLEVDFDLGEGVKEDNKDESHFTEEDRAIIKGEFSPIFETVEPVIDDKDLTFIEERGFDDLTVRSYSHSVGRTVERVFQTTKGSTQERLVQEYSYNK